MGNIDITGCYGKLNFINHKPGDLTQKHAPDKIKGKSQKDIIVSVSDNSKELYYTAREAVRAEPEIRFGKAEKIKGEILEGNYEINVERIAEKMLSDLTAPTW